MTSQDEILAAIDANRRALRAEVARVRADDDVSASGRARALTAAYQTAAARHDRLKRDYLAGRDAAEAAQRAAAFGPPGGPNTMAAYRHALETADRAPDGATLRTLLDRARRVGERSRGARCRQNVTFPDNRRPR